MITSVLVANRGEIARRIFRTCRVLGLTTVAVYSDSDADAPHVREADAAVRLPGHTSTDTYLRGDLLVEAAKRGGADAIHPGYGFLSESAAFARQVEAAGLTWIGPPATAIEAMGTKVEAKRLMAAAGVPVLDTVDPVAGDLPVLVKASAGGGGRGMRVVRTMSELAGALESARAEALSAFGDDTVFCEPYVDDVRHVEVQLLADTHGTVWAVGERECSIQRRHQKVVEETPSPLVERLPGLRDKLFEAAIAAGRAVGYVGAGTVEFLVDEGGRSFFLELNTRLQVEHPVIEATTGLDLVQLQVRIADGMALPADPPPARGHAIEARLYAEDPAHAWQPQSGVLHRFSIPAVDGLRVDSGVENGSTISPFYDALLAKVIAHAPTRDEAATRLAGALERAALHGPRTNRDLLVRVLRHPAFRAGDTTTAFLEQHDVRAPLADEQAERMSALAAALADAAANRAATRVNGGLPSGWRNVPSQAQVRRFEGIDVSYRLTRDGLVADGHPDVALVTSRPDSVVLEVGGVRRSFAVARYGEQVFVDSALGPVRLTLLPRFADPADQLAPGSLLAPMPGIVARIVVREGDPVGKGQPLLWLEAMKMEHPVAAPVDGYVAALPVEQGQQVEVGDVLAVVERKEDR